MSYEQSFFQAAAVFNKLCADLARGSVLSDCYYRQPLDVCRQHSGTPIKIWLNKRLPAKRMLASGATFTADEDQDEPLLESVLFSRVLMPLPLFDCLQENMRATLLLEFVNIRGQTVRIAAKKSTILHCGSACVCIRRDVADEPLCVADNLGFLFRGDVAIDCSGS